MSDKEMAKLAIDKVHCDKYFSDRAKLLLDKPVMINQSCFGVCGMAAAVRVLLDYDPMKFADLFKSIFSGTAFKSAENGRLINAFKLLSTLESEYKANPKAGGDPNLVGSVNTLAKLDFMMCRSLGHLVEYFRDENGNKVTQGIMEMQKQFLAEFRYPGMDPDIKKGHLAITEEFLDIIMNLLLGVYWSFQIQAYNPYFETIVVTINTLFEKETPFVFAGVKKALTLLSKGDVTLPVKRVDPKTLHVPVSGERGKITTEGKNPTLIIERDEPLFTHWIVITGPIISQDQYYIVPSWSWARNINIKILKSVAPDYFFSFVAGIYKKPAGIGDEDSSVQYIKKSTHFTKDNLADLKDLVTKYPGLITILPEEGDGDVLKNNELLRRCKPVFKLARIPGKSPVSIAPFDFWQDTISYEKWKARKSVKTVDEVLNRYIECYKGKGSISARLELAREVLNKSQAYLEGAGTRKAAVVSLRTIFSMEVEALELAANPIVFSKQVVEDEQPVKKLRRTMSESSLLSPKTRK